MTKKEFVSMSLPYGLKVLIPESETKGCCCGHNKVQPYIGVIQGDIQKMIDLGYKVKKNSMYPKSRSSFYPKSV